VSIALLKRPSDAAGYNHVLGLLHYNTVLCNLDLSAVSLPSVMVPVLAGGLYNNASLRSLAVTLQSSCGYAELLASAVAHHTALRHLRVVSRELNCDYMAAWAQALDANRLRSLELTNVSSSSSSSSVAAAEFKAGKKFQQLCGAIARNTSLRSLALHVDLPTQSFASMAKAIQKNNGISSVSLVYSLRSIFSSSSSSLSAAPSLPSVRSRSSSAASIGSDSGADDVSGENSSSSSSSVITISSAGSSGAGGHKSTKRMAAIASSFNRCENLHRLSVEFVGTTASDAYLQHAFCCSIIRHHPALLYFRFNASGSKHEDAECAAALAKNKALCVLRIQSERYGAATDVAHAHLERNLQSRYAGIVHVLPFGPDVGNLVVDYMQAEFDDDDELL
jgi:hypothetical protein